MGVLDDDGTFGEMGEGEFITSSDGVGFLGPDWQANLERIIRNQQGRHADVVTMTPAWDPGRLA